MTMPQGQKPQVPRDQVPGVLTYNAWLAAIRDNCQCPACQHLRKLTPYLSIPVPLDQLQGVETEEA